MTAQQRCIITRSKAVLQVSTAAARTRGLVWQTLHIIQGQPKWIKKPFRMEKKTKNRKAYNVYFELYG